MPITTIEDIFDNVVDSLRLMGTVDNLVQDPLDTSVYTFDTDSIGNLAVDKFIQFDNGNRGKITAINVNTATVKVYYENTPVAGNFKRLDPFFDQDLSIDIAKKYASMSTDQLETEYLKFPAVELVRDQLSATENQYQRENYDSVELIFVNWTNPEWTGSQRHENNYKGVLIPLFDDFKEALQRDANLRQPQNIEFQKAYLDKASYAGTNQNSLNHFIDIIRVRVSGLILNTEIECSINL